MARKWRGPEARPLRLRLFGGLFIFVMTLYCGPLRRTGKKRSLEGAGIYPELGMLGFQEGKSPFLIRDIGRLTALLPSYETVQQELSERGLKLNIKEVHGIGQYAGQAALTFRGRELEQFRAGQLAPGDGKGKRFGAMIDGGRTKIRKSKYRQKGQGKTKSRKRRYQTDWREPKQIIVFEMDEQGRMKKGTKPILDGTFKGPDEIMEILAMRLHQVGASEAKVVAFRADGAPWIWDRLEWIRQRLGMSQEQVSSGLDWCHAVHHVNLALELLVPPEDRMGIFKRLRKWLKQGAWRKVTGELTNRMLKRESEGKVPVWNEIDYLEGHGKAGHLDYAKYRRRNLPIGSGAIESAIRRVINLRMKGNSVFWEEDNAEGMLVMRGLVLSRRWTETFAKISESMAWDRHLSWAWKSPNMPAQVKAGVEIQNPSPQHQDPTRCYTAAA